MVCLKSGKCLHSLLRITLYEKALQQTYCESCNEKTVQVWSERAAPWNFLWCWECCVCVLFNMVATRPVSLLNAGSANGLRRIFNFI